MIYTVVYIKIVSCTILHISYSLQFQLCLLHNLLFCNCKAVQVDICNEFLLQMFRIPLVQTGTIYPLHYPLIVTLMHVYNYYQLFACLLTSMLYQYTPVYALLWPGGAIWLHALAIELHLTRYLYLSFIYTIGGIPKKYSDIKESDNDPTITLPGV